jgi:hypothetical protein
MGHVLLCLEEMGHFSAALVDRNYGLAWPARARVCVSKKKKASDGAAGCPVRLAIAIRQAPLPGRLHRVLASLPGMHLPASLTRPFRSPGTATVPHRRFAARSADGRIPNPIAGVKAASPEFSHIVKHRYSRRK